MSRKSRVAVLGLVVLSLLVVVIRSLDPPEDASDLSNSAAEHRQQAPDSFTERVAEAFRPLAEDLSDVARNGVAWSIGKYPGPQFAADLDVSLAGFVLTRDRIAALPEYSRAPKAQDLYLQSARLTLEFLRVYRIATEPGMDALKTQLDLLARRLRVLGDRVYDRAKLAVAPFEDPAGDFVEARLLEEVPNWAEEGLAPGPPLADAPPSGASVPEREPARPQQHEAAWLNRIRGAAIPSATRLAAAVEAGDIPTLGGLADEFTAVVEGLREVPDPANGGRERHALLRLGLLVHGESARTAQVAALVPDGVSRQRLLNVSRRLALIGDHLWDDGLDPRSSGFEPNLLFEAGR